MAAHRLKNRELTPLDDFSVAPEIKVQDDVHVENPGVPAGYRAQQTWPLPPSVHKSSKPGKLANLGRLPGTGENLRS